MKKLKSNHVEKIVTYLKEKRAKAETRLKEYMGPVLSAELRNSPHMQVEHTRITTSIELLDDVIMTIEKFCDDVLPSEESKPVKRRKSNVKAK